MDEVIKSIIEALMTDGAHHKQYFLERIFRQLCEDDYVNKAKTEFQWDEGVAP